MNKYLCKIHGMEGDPKEIEESSTHNAAAEYVRSLMWSTRPPGETLVEQTIVVQVIDVATNEKWLLTVKAMPSYEFFAYDRRRKVE